MRDGNIDLRVESLSGRMLRGGQSRAADLRIGDRVRICFRVSRPGYVSLWSRQGPAQLEQLFPNEHTPPGADWVDDTEQCLGEEGAEYGFEVQPPAGESDVVLYYTADESYRLAEDDYPVIRSGRSTGPQPWATSTVTFRIVD